MPSNKILGLVGLPLAGTAMAGEYRALHKYLHERYADTIVMTFGEIEDLIGFSLPDAARVEPAWWAIRADKGLTPGLLDARPRRVR